MSEVVSAMPRAETAGTITIREAGLRGMITLRGDFSGSTFREAVSRVTGVEFSEQRRVALSGERGLCWMSPDELLVLVSYSDAGRVVEDLSSSLDGQHHLAVDVSDARAVFRLEGDGTAIREVLAKLSPADLRKAALPVGEVRRTRLAQVPAAFWFADDRCAELVCFRSVADYVWGLLTDAATVGSEVGHF